MYMYFDHLCLEYWMRPTRQLYQRRFKIRFEKRISGNQMAWHEKLLDEIEFLDFRMALTSFTKASAEKPSTSVLTRELVEIHL